MPPRDSNCVFCKIVNGDLPASLVLDDSEALVFLDVAPLAPGHLLLIPKIHYELISDMPEDECGRLLALVPRLGAALIKITGKVAFNVLCNNRKEAGQVVPHVHIHLIPRVAGDALGYRWNPRQYGEGEMESLERRYRDALI